VRRLTLALIGSALAVAGCGGAAASTRSSGDPAAARAAAARAAAARAAAAAAGSGLTVPGSRSTARSVRDSSPLPTGETTTGETTTSEATTSGPGRTAPARARPPSASGPFRVGERVLTLVDHSRRVRFPGRSPEPRTLVTEVWYPRGTSGPEPLIVFGHGYAVTPAPYRRLLEAWARAGYIVAAPIFPLENANAPGGPDESDLVNQPRDVSFVITSLTRLAHGSDGFLAGRLESRQVAVTGQSDGGETALAVAYDRHFIDHRIRAAAILSGAEIPGVGGFDFPAPSPPLLATQGTADTVNQPHFTYDFFRIAPRPKFLLQMYGAPHLGPYTNEQPQLRIVERVTIAFFERYLRGWHRALGRMARAGDVGSVSGLQSYP
jgi:dienelactone hydrolase